MLGEGGPGIPCKKAGRKWRYKKNKDGTKEGKKCRRGEKGVWSHGTNARSPFCASCSTQACFVMRWNGPSGHVACLHRAHTWAFVCRWKTASVHSLSGKRVHRKQYMFMKAKRCMHSEHSFDVKWVVNHFQTNYCVTPRMNVFTLIKLCKQKIRR